MNEKLHKVNMIFGHIEMMPPRYEIDGSKIRCFMGSRTIDRSGKITEIKKTEGLAIVCGSEKQARELLRTIK